MAPAQGRRPRETMSGFGVRVDQAPPLLVPLRFFLTAPVFGVAATIVLLWGAPQSLAERWNPTLLAATHLLTLGFLTMTMIGALMQMLPVLAGSALRHPRGVATAVHALLVGGTFALAANFLAPVPLLRYGALIALAGGLGIFLVAAGASLARALTNHSVIAMRIALAGLAVSVSLGLILGSGHVPSLLGLMPKPADLHIGWALIGWVAMLVIGVGYQVVPMFQLTPAYPTLLRVWLAPLTGVALIIWTVAKLAEGPASAWLEFIGTALLVATLAAFAVTTLYLQRARRRRLPDATARFWTLSMLSLLVGVALATAHATGVTVDMRIMPLATAWIVIGFGVSVILGMLYKIVPFLVWLHLQARNIPDPPSMKEIVPDSRALPHVWLHAVAIVLFALAGFVPCGLQIAALALLASFMWLGANLVLAALLYRRRLRLPANAARR